MVRNFFQDPHETPERSSSRRSKRKKRSVRIQDTPTNIVKEINQEEKLSKSRKERTEDRKQRKLKGKETLKLSIKPQNLPQKRTTNYFLKD